jgi:hypothetical protein
MRDEMTSKYLGPLNDSELEQLMDQYGFQSKQIGQENYAQREGNQHIIAPIQGMPAPQEGNYPLVDNQT